MSDTSSGVFLGRRLRDANEDPRLEHNARVFRDIVRLAYGIRKQRWTGNTDQADAAVLHDALTVISFSDFIDLMTETLGELYRKEHRRAQGTRR